MLVLKYFLELAGFALFAAAVAIVRYYLRQPDSASVPPWRFAGNLGALALVPLLAGLSIEAVPAGTAGVRISQISGTLPGTLYPGLHFVLPLVQSVAT